MSLPDPFSARASLGPGLPDLYRLSALDNLRRVERPPVTLRILQENVLRSCGRGPVRPEDAEALAGWQPGRSGSDREVPFMPGRVLLQDFTGVPAVVDLAALRDAMADLGGDPSLVNPLVPADLVIDHSVQVDAYGSPGAFLVNVGREYERNGERYQLLRWAQTAFDGFRVVPPGTGIVHQVNLEYLATVISDAEDEAGRVAFPDTVVGTDSHTTMVDALGVLGFGVGGIEAEAVMLGQPVYLPMPRIVGVALQGELPKGATATDLVLVVTQMLRAYGVVNAFVEFAGDGLASLALADRATISNMSPEFGATATIFPIDDETLDYLRLTARPADRVALVEAYARTQGLWREPGLVPEFDDLLELDLATVEPSVAGPRRPQDRVRLADLPGGFRDAFPELAAEAAAVLEEGRLTSEGGQTGATDDGGVAVEVDGATTVLHSGSVVIAAITSCTNTSNPTVMVGAGLLARNAVARGLRTPRHVKTSLAPGSKVVTGYLAEAGLMDPLEKLGFALAGYGCTTCIGNSGPLDAPIAQAVEEGDLVVAAVLSGNRNFDGRIHPLARASYLASPPLVVAFALAGRVDIDLTREPLGIDDDGKAVYLTDIWPSASEIRDVIGSSIDPALFARTYADVFGGDERWRAMAIPEGDRYAWDPESTYVARPSFLMDIPAVPPAVADIEGARALVMVGDSVTTDHISPAGSIAASSPAGRWLQDRGITPLEFNSYGARRGHHEVMVRGTFANIRLRNQLAVDGREGPWTTHLPSGDDVTIYDAAMRYRDEDVPLVVLAGREYGSGSSRDWAAKGPAMLGVRAVIAESYERIHRSNLVGMGILPLEYPAGESAATLGLTGREAFTIRWPTGAPAPRRPFAVVAERTDGSTIGFEAASRLDGPIDVEYYRQGGILPAVLRRLMATSEAG